MLDSNASWCRELLNQWYYNLETWCMRGKILKKNKGISPIAAVIVLMSARTSCRSVDMHTRIYTFACQLRLLPTSLAGD